MRFLALACDFDGTLAHNGKVDESTLDALRRLRASGRQLLLVSGRELEDLQSVFDHLDLFDRAVLENGALLYRPATREEKLLGEAPSETFLAALRRRKVEPLSIGRVIVATWRPHETAVLEAIQECGLALQIIFNKEAVMVLPAGLTKATGLTCALEELGLSAHNIVAIGDAENDHALLDLAECGVAVDNALPALKDRADFVTKGARGAGVVELIDELLATDLANREDRLTRHHLDLGENDRGDKVRLPPYGTNLLIAGPSGSGKSTAATSVLERLIESRYQFCLIDPEGDYSTFRGAVILGGPEHGPTIEEIMQLLAQPSENGIVNLIGLPLEDRPAFFMGLLPRLQEMRARLGRPHWLVVDEAHHMFPVGWERGEPALPLGLDCTALITVHPGQVHPAVLSEVDSVLAVGASPDQTMREFCQTINVPSPNLPHVELKSGEVLYWSRKQANPPYRVHLYPPQTERLRHVRKYAEGQLPPDRSFYFRGPQQRLNLRAQNLLLFLQIGEGVDDDTWMHHLQQGDYSRWLRDCIKDEELAEVVEQVEKHLDTSTGESRRLIRQAIERRYTLPAAPTLPGANHPGDGPHGPETTERP